MFQSKDRTRTTPYYKSQKLKTNKIRMVQFFSILKLKQKAFKLAGKEKQETDAKCMQETRQREPVTATIEHDQKNRPGNENFKMICYNDNRWFSPDVLATMLVHRTKEKNVFQEFDSKYYYPKHVGKLPLFCAPTCLSYHMIENHL